MGVAPWPWTVNAAGRGTHHDSKGDAIATVLAIMERGFPYIDVGCFQVDLLYHAGVFRSLDEAFDPERNAEAAARILLTNRMSSPDWDTAVARYHSATPALGIPYLERVHMALPAATWRALSARADRGDPEPVLPSVPAVSPAKLPTVIYAYPLPLSIRAPTAIRSSARSDRNRRN